MTARAWAILAGATLFGLVAADCTFDSTAEAPFPVLQSLVIQDPVTAGTDCTLRARAMMWLIHQYDAEATPHFAALPTTINADVMTPNGPACEYATALQIRLPAWSPTVPWFVMAMNESDWIAECRTPLLKHAAPGQPLSGVGAIRFVRGEASCTVGGP